MITAGMVNQSLNYRLTRGMYDHKDQLVADSLNYQAGDWIPVEKEPHPLNEEFVAWYGTGEKRVVYFTLVRDLGIVKWYPLPATDPEEIE